MQTFGQDKHRSRIVVIESLGVSENMDARYRQTQETWYRTVEMFLSMTPVKNSQRNLHVLAVALIGAGDELLNEWLVTGDRYPMPILINEYQAILNDILTPLFPT